MAYNSVVPVLPHIFFGRDLPSDPGPSAAPVLPDTFFRGDFQLGPVPLLPHMIFAHPLQQDSRPDDETYLFEKLIGKFLKTRKPCPKDKEEENVCAVCLDDLDGPESIGILECRHEFHVGCTRKWLRKKNLCPLCKGVALGPQQGN